MHRFGLALVVAVLFSASWAHAQDASRPNIVILWGDDIGYWNVSAYNQGMMGYKTLFNLRSDPFETADHERMDYPRWRVEHLFLLVPAQQYVGRFLGSFRDFPPRQKPGSFSIDDALESLQKGTGR